MVWKLDRLGRSVKNLVDLVCELQHQGVQFQSLTGSINSGTPPKEVAKNLGVSVPALYRWIPASSPA